MVYQKLIQGKARTNANDYLCMSDHCFPCEPEIQHRPDNKGSMLDLKQPRGARGRQTITVQTILCMTKGCGSTDLNALNKMSALAPLRHLLAPMSIDSNGNIAAGWKPIVSLGR